MLSEGTDSAHLDTGFDGRQSGRSQTRRVFQMGVYDVFPVPPQRHVDGRDRTRSGHCLYAECIDEADSGGQRQWRMGRGPSLERSLQNRALLPLVRVVRCSISAQPG